MKRRKIEAPTERPTASESVLRLGVTYRVQGWGHDGDSYGIDWTVLANAERIELDRLLWKSRQKDNVVELRRSRGD